MSTLSHLGVVGEDLSLHAIKDKGIKSLESACKWLDGEWLEHYVLQQVQEILKTYLFTIALLHFGFGIQSILKILNFSLMLPSYEDISSLRSLVQLSLVNLIANLSYFEAYIRARQLGGDEARVALVCCASEKDVNALENRNCKCFNPAPESGKRNHKIAVFGRDDLMDLASRIAEWIKQNDKDAR